MDRILIEGGVPLDGTVEISGAKNAALPIMSASLLTAEPLDLAQRAGPRRHRLDPEAAAASGRLGDPCRRRARTGWCCTHRRILTDTAPYDLVRKMRASVLVLGPLLARTGAARVSLPGGCAIGPRPIDLHLMGMERLGATIELEDGYVHAQAPDGLNGGEIRLPQPSVGATENLLMAAALARGETPDRRCRARARDRRSRRLPGRDGGEDRGRRHRATSRIDGRAVRCTAPATRIIPDRIEAGTYAMAAGVTGGSILLKNARLDCSGRRQGGDRGGGHGAGEPAEGGVWPGRQWRPASGSDAMTRPFPGFATDLQAQFMALMSVAEGAAMITETIFENRFMHVPELARMGARINVHGASALVRGRQAS